MDDAYLHCFATAYRVKSEICPLVTQSLFGANLPTMEGYGVEYGTEREHPEEAPRVLGGFLVEGEKIVTSFIQRFFGRKGSRFDSRKELVDALNAFLEQSEVKSYEQFSKAVKDFASQEKLGIRPLEVRHLSSENSSNSLEKLLSRECFVDKLENNISICWNYK